MIVATGNGGADVAVNWPACLPHVIKVSSVINDGIGNTRYPTANLANPTAFPLEQFWLAPGGQNTTFPPVGSGILSSISSSSSPIQTGNFVGTSMAAPHIAGLYAVLKAVTRTLVSTVYHST